MLLLVGLWGLGRLPVAQIQQEIARTRANLLSLVQIPDLSVPTPAVTSMRTAAQPGVLAAAPVVPRPTTSVPEPTAASVVLATSPTPEPATATPEPGAGPSTTPAANTYTVQEGDTLAGIGARLGIPWQLLAATNGLNANSVLMPGQRLLLPEPTATALPMPESTATPVAATATPEPTLAAATPSPSPTGIPGMMAAGVGATPTSGPVIYRVQPGDILVNIGARFGVPWQAIAAANNLAPTTTLRVGQELIIPPPGAPLPPTPTPRPRPTATPLPPTPTPAPAYPAPVLLNPADGTPYSGSTAFIELTWEPVPGLPGDAQYQVVIRWSENGVEQEHLLPPTTRTGVQVPAWLWGRADKPARQYIWFVTAVQVTADGQGNQQIIPLSPPSPSRVFFWN